MKSLFIMWTKCCNPEILGHELAWTYYPPMPKDLNKTKYIQEMSEELFYPWKMAKTKWAKKPCPKHPPMRF